MLNPDPWIKEITGESLNPDYYLDYLEKNGAPAFLLNDYIGMSPEKASQLIDALNNTGTDVPRFLSELGRTRDSIQSMAEKFFSVDVLAEAVAKIIQNLENSGIASGVEINQNFYGNNLTPSEVARETASALKLQGVGI